MSYWDTQNAYVQNNMGEKQGQTEWLENLEKTLAIFSWNGIRGMPKLVYTDSQCNCVAVTPEQALPLVLLFEQNSSFLFPFLPSPIQPQGSLASIHWNPKSLNPMKTLLFLHMSSVSYSFSLLPTPHSHLLFVSKPDLQNSNATSLMKNAPFFPSRSNHFCSMLPWLSTVSTIN